MSKQLNLFLHSTGTLNHRKAGASQPKAAGHSKSASQPVDGQLIDGQRRKKKTDGSISEVSKKEWTRLNRRTHGGADTIGRRKEFRPISSKRSMHLVLKSDRASGRYSMLSARNQIFIRSLVYAKARKFGVKLVSFVNVGNHLHLSIRPRNRQAFQSFLRSITNLISRFVTGARRGKPFGKFWQGLAYTRVLSSRLEELQLFGYIEANRLEAVRSRSAREAWLNRWNQYISQLRNPTRPVAAIESS